MKPFPLPSRLLLPAFLTVLGIACLATSVPALAQKTGGNQTMSAGKAREHRVQVVYTPGIAQTYELVETTKAKRIQSDSTTKEYDRKVTYMITVRCLENMEGVATLSVNLDSLKYEFTSGGVVVTYDSQVDVAPPNFMDLNTYLGPLNRSYEMTYSPYGEVVKIKGEQIEFWRDYFQENAGTMDSVASLIWSNSLDRPALLQFGDLQKRVIPGTRVAADSMWTTPLQIRNDGITYEGKAHTKLESYSGGFYHMVTKDTIPARPDQKFYTFGVQEPAMLLNGQTTVEHSLDMANGGVIDAVTQTTHAWYRAKVQNEIFNKDIVTTTTWKLRGQFQW